MVGIVVIFCWVEVIDGVFDFVVFNDEDGFCFV